jgi:hypothetical protein
MPDPVLKAAAEEIKSVLRKHDIAALITLQSPNSVEYVREVSPTWSCAKVEQMPDGLMIRVRAKSAEFASKQDQKLCVERTVGMLIGFKHQSERDADCMSDLIYGVAKQVGPIDNFLRDE